MDVSGFIRFEDLDGVNKFCLFYKIVFRDWDNLRIDCVVSSVLMLER